MSPPSFSFAQIAKTSFALLGLIPASLNAATVIDIAGNNLVSGAQFISPADFTLEFVAIIDSSTSYNHATIAASGSGSTDWFSFDYTAGRLILDIDFGMPTVDLELAIWDSSGTLISTNDDKNSADPGSVDFLGDYNDPFIDVTNLVPGRYFVAVSVFPSAQANNFVVGDTGLATPAYSYNLHISSAVPEPGSAMLLCLAPLALGVRRRR